MRAISGVPFRDPGRVADVGRAQIDRDEASQGLAVPSFAGAAVSQLPAPDQRVDDACLSYRQLTASSEPIAARRFTRSWIRR